MIHHLSIDLETYSSVSIKKSGAQAYIRSPDFEILLFAYSLDGGPSTVIDMASGDTVPWWLYDALINPDYIKHAFNAAFEWGCLSRHLGLKLPPSQWRDQCFMACIVVILQAWMPLGGHWGCQRTSKS